MSIQLYQGDCLELMNNIPDGSIDMILCDLPFGMTRNKWDTVIPFDKLWEQYNRVAKENAAVALFAMMPFTAKLVTSNLKNFKYMWVWYKHYARGFLNARKQPLRTTENICLFYRKQCTYNPQMTKGEYRQKGSSGKQRGCYGNYHAMNIWNDTYYPTYILDFAGVPTPQLSHPTQKPVDLCEYLVRTYTNPGETVLDNCMGSGTTGVACKNTGRNFVGIELNEEYFKVAQQRLGGGVEDAML